MPELFDLKTVNGMPKCPTVAEKEKFHRWMEDLKRLSYGMDLTDVLFQDKPNPCNKPLTWEKKNRQAFHLLYVVLGGNHNDVFVADDFQAFKVMQRLQEKFGQLNSKNGRDAHFALEAFFEVRMKEEGDLGTNLANFITDVNTLAETANAVAGKEAVSEELKTHHLIKNCGKLSKLVDTAVIAMQDRSYTKVVRLLNELTHMPAERLAEMLGETPSPQPSPPPPVQNVANYAGNRKGFNKFKHKKFYKPFPNYGKFQNKGRQNFNKKYVRDDRNDRNHYGKKNKNDRPDVQSPKRFRGRCHYCKEEGHTVAKCDKLPREDDIYPNKAHVAVNLSYLVTTDQESYIYWDSCSSDNNFNSKDYFDSYKKVDFDEENRISSATGHSAIPEGIGLIAGVEFNYIPSFPDNLVSMGRMSKLGFKSETEDGFMLITHKSLPGVHLKAILAPNNVYRIKLTEFIKVLRLLNGKGNPKVNYLTQRKSGHDFLSFHKITHLNVATYNRLVQLKLLNGLKNPVIRNVHNFQCKCCIKAKLRRKAYKKRRGINPDLEPLVVLITDVKGPLTPLAYNNARYVVSFIDEKTRFKWVYCISTKDEVADALEKLYDNVLKPLVRTLHSSTIQFRTIKSDGGTEYMGRFAQKCKEFGFRQEIVPRYTPELNGIAENYWRTLFSIVRAMFFNTPNIPLHYWPDVVLYANDVLNSTLVVPVNNILKTPYEWLYGRTPSLQHYRKLGEKHLVHMPSEKLNNSTFSERAEEMFFLGFKEGYIHSAKFLQRKGNMWKIVVADYDNSVPVTNEEENLAENVEQELEIVGFNSINNDESRNIVNEDESEKNHLENPKESVKVTKKRKRNDDLPQERRKSPRLLEKEQNKLARKAYAVMLEAKFLTLNEVLKIEDTAEQIRYLDAAYMEIDSIDKRGVWSLVDKKESMRLLKTKWVFTIKTDSNGNEIRKKGRLVILGNNAIPGQDFTDTYAPVTKLPALRVFLSIVNQFSLHMYQLDVDTAFLYADLEQEIFIEIPAMFTYRKNRGDIRGKCLKLSKALYGLPQAPRAWFQTIDKFFREAGYKPLVHEPCLYIKVLSTGFVAIMTLYVDDMILAHNNQEELMKLVDEIERRFKIKRIGEPKKMLGIEIGYDKVNGIMELSTSLKIRKVAKEFDINTGSTLPMNPTIKYSAVKVTDLSEEEQSLYRSLIGKLMFIMVATRPDIAYSVSLLAQYMSLPSKQHYEAALQVLRYLYSTQNLVLRYKRRPMDQYTMVAYSDSDWGGNLDNRRSRSGGIILLGGTPIYWSSNVQTLVALSSAEAEINALKEVVKNVLWIRGILKDTTLLPKILSEPTLIYEDNSSVLEIVMNAEISKRNRHYDMSYHFIKENVEEFRNILIRWITTDKNIADLFTKALMAQKFIYFRDFILKWRK